ncbi:MAG TPA: prenyltransferase/squalene oxidase repeat-containing protein [Chthoniobacteraceae bacterium]|jgi:hypothetical protein|nr:prenyltransferase/squalene oxidase repeat-containing protein [Chthoniobacteraceae bacterium]
MPRLLALPFFLFVACFPFCTRAASPPDATLTAALKFLAAQQQPDGSFGGPQPHLKAAFATLAVLSTGERNTPGLATRAVSYLAKDANASGFLGDEAFPTESHSVVLTALICAHAGLPAEARTEAGERIQRGLRHLLQLQDRSSGTASRGGWSMEAKPGRPNDRRATGWALVALRTARAHGLEVPQPNVDRAVNFLLGSFKEQADNASQLGGFSVDTEGLAVELMSALGGWVLTTAPAKEAWRKMNLAWLTSHPPAWTGPNYFYSGFFRLRALKFSEASAALSEEQSQRFFTQIADHQKADGSILLPPGDAQNMVSMGPVFSTAMAILILNTADSRLAPDEDFRVVPNF